jgi:AcrR family transcriptional regulator
MQAEAQLAKSAILEVALQLAEKGSWDRIHLFEVAREMGVGLADIHRHFRNKDALAEAWFDLADAALLRLAQTPGWLQVPQKQRLQFAYSAWLDALAGHRRLTREMIGYRLSPSTCTCRCAACCASATRCSGSARSPCCPPRAGGGKGPRRC